MSTSLFLKEKPSKTLISLLQKDRTWYLSLLMKEVNCAYAHLVNIVNKLERLGLVKTEGEGRIRRVWLTEEGEDIARDLEGLWRRLERVERKVEGQGV